MYWKKLLLGINQELEQQLSNYKLMNAMIGFAKCEMEAMDKLTNQESGQITSSKCEFCQ